MTAELQADLEAMLPALEIVAVRAVGADHARNVVQEVMTRALAAIAAGRVADGARLPAFVHGIARHVIADVHRARARMIFDNEIASRVAASEPNALETLISAEEKRAVERALLALSSADRELLRRCYLNGERVEDIAQSLSEPAQRIRKRKSRALQRLRGLLSQDPEAGHVSSPAPTFKP